MIPSAATHRAERFIAHFNRSTNRLIAGTRFGVVRAATGGVGSEAAGAAGAADAAWAAAAESTGATAGAGSEAERALSLALTRMLRDMGAKVVEWVEGEPIPDGLAAVFSAADLADGDAPADRDALVAAGIPVIDPGCAPIGPRTVPGESLAKRGAARIEWAHRFMPVTRELAEEFAASGALRGVRIGVVLVLEPKTAVLVLELARAGADVRVFAPASEVDSETAAALRARGIVVLASSDADPEHEAEQARDLMRWQPQLLIDDGAHLIRLAHDMPESRESLRGAAEETTSGVRPLRNMHAEGRLAVPVVPVNDATVKTLFDNLHGTGQTCVFAIADELERIRSAQPLPQGVTRVPRVADSSWLVLGYGPVGVGVCRHARALGARVTVAELDPVRALAAETDGYEVARAADAVRSADVVVSASGVPGTLDVRLARLARSGTVFAVAGGVDGELDFGASEWIDAPDISPHVSLVRAATATEAEAVRDPEHEAAHDPEHRVVVLAHGHGVNYTASGGNPIEIMDLSFAAQLAALDQLIALRVLEEGTALAGGLFPLAVAHEQRIARLALAARGSAADRADEAQDRAAREWRNQRYGAAAQQGPRTMLVDVDVDVDVDADADATGSSGAEAPARPDAHARPTRGTGGSADADSLAARREAGGPAAHDAGSAPSARPDIVQGPREPGVQEAVPTVMVYSARLVIPVTGPRIVGGAVAVKGDRIMHVGDRAWVLSSLESNGLDYAEEHWPGVITPGLVNAHTHLQYTGMAEVSTRRYRGFDDWSRAFDEVYEGRSHDWAAEAARGAALAFASGTTACADVVTDEAAASALHDAGMHGIAYWEVMGWSNAEWQRSGRDATAAQLDSMPATPGVGVSPHAPYSLEVQPLLDVPDIVRGRGMRLHIHLAEAHMEHEHHSAHEEWPELGAESFRALRSRGVGVSSTQFVDHLGVLGPDCHIAHGVYMTDRDRSLLRARGTSVALCPRSNEVIGLDLPPVAAYLREGNAICVGTDSLSSSPSLDPLADVALLYRIAREQGYGDADLHQRLFGAVTLGGATALGLGVGAHRIGQLAVGALADLAFFDIDAADPDDALAALVENGAGSCRRTIVAGVTTFAHGTPAGTGTGTNTDTDTDTNGEREEQHA